MARTTWQAAPGCSFVAMGNCRRSIKSRGFLRGFARIQTAVGWSVAIGADSDADAGRADADPATVSIAAALDMTLAAGSISV
jgi:hypothetical protein